MSSVGSSRPSQYAPASNSFAGRPDPNRRIAIVAYVVGLTGFTIALVVLFLNSRWGAVPAAAGPALGVLPSSPPSSKRLPPSALGTTYAVSQ
jgi:hypothetical protein